MLKKLKKINKKYLIIIIVSIIIIIVSLLSTTIVLFRHKRKVQLIKKEIQAIEREKELIRLEKERKEKERLAKIKAEEEKLKIVSTAQKEKNNFKYNKSAQKELHNLYDSTKKHVYLTFDDGPSKITVKVLDILKEEKVPATFFILGTNIEGREAILRRIYNEGHTIGNHSFTHNYGKIYKDSQEILKEYSQTEKALKKVLGKDFNSNLFRFPGGSFGGEYHNQKQKIKSSLKEKNISYIDWNVVTDDSMGVDTSKEQIKIFNETRKGKKTLIILQHDSFCNKSLPQTLKSIIKTLKKEGYVFKNFNDILVKEEKMENKEVV